MNSSTRAGARGLCRATSSGTTREAAPHAAGPSLSVLGQDCWPSAAMRLAGAAGRASDTRVSGALSGEFYNAALILRDG